MRKCLRCQTEMQEGYALFESDSYWRIVAAEDGKWFPREMGKLSCAVCPACGYVELFVEDTKKV
ncbi:hypothetical protein [Acutalibacter caecimuris]|uniref:hypothetical protein n=1 Tax=Acutalibacter caecimuris TaxID=3093657 RepID=UPI002AC95E1F|nr:hypothetical protein [Acutalibacter sp. M00118]